MSDYVKSIAKQGTAEWSNYDGDLKPKTDYVILAFYVDPNNEDQLKVYDYAYTKAEFRTETPETEISLTLGDIKNLTDNGDEYCRGNGSCQGLPGHIVSHRRSHADRNR